MRDFLDFLKTFKFHILAVVLLCFAHGMVRGAEAEKPLPADAQKAVSTCDMAIGKARMELVKGLKISLAKATKAGDLVSANLVQAKLTETEKLLDEGKDLLGNKTAHVSTSQRITIYALPDFKGPSYTVAASEIGVVLDTYKIGFPNDALRSIKLPAGYKLTVYAAEQAGGASFVITEESADLTATPAYTLGMSSFVAAPIK